MDCPQCFEKAVVKDQHGCQEQTVCESCGAVFSENDFVTPSADELGNSNENKLANIPWDKRRVFAKKISATMKCGLERIKYLASEFKLSPNDESCAVDLFKKNLEHSNFKRCQLIKKKTLSVCCVYVILRQNHQPITPAQICSTAQISLPLFNKIYGKMKQILNLEITPASLKELVPIYVKDSRIESKDLVVEKATKIVGLCKKVWLTHSRKPDSVVSSAVYLAWSSMDINQRTNVNYSQFCQKYNVKFVSSGNSRCTEMLSMFRKLGEQLPWVNTKDINKKRHLLHCIDKILENANLLCRLSVGGDSDQDLWKTFVPHNKCSKFTPEGEIDFRTDVPISVSLDPELTEDDIPDDKMHLYVRNEEEIQQLRLFKYKYELCK